MEMNKHIGGGIEGDAQTEGAKYRDLRSKPESKAKLEIERGRGLGRGLGLPLSRKFLKIHA